MYEGEKLNLTFLFVIQNIFNLLRVHNSDFLNKKFDKFRNHIQNN